MSEIKLQKYQKPVLIPSSALKNGWTANGNSFYCISGSMLILHLSVRHGNIGAAGTELVALPFACTEIWSPNLYRLSDGNIVLRENGVVEILSEVANPKRATIIVDIITILR